MVIAHRGAWIVALSFAVASSVGYATSAGARATSSAYIPVLATPFGIRTEPLGKAQGWGLDKDSAAGIVREEIAYTDLRGHTLYTYDKDPAGKSVCVDDCAKTWIPMAARSDAKPFGAWSVIVRPDGGRQWAFKGKPLYSFLKDEDPGSVAGVNVAKIVGRGPNVGSRGSFRGQRPKPGVLPEGWHVALLYPNDDIKLPVGFSIKDSPDAGGLVMNDAHGHTLYMFDGNADEDQKDCNGMSCSTEWIPVEAPEIAQPSGDFAFISRHDGIHQWTFQGHGLYTYAGDLVAGDVNGMNTNPHWKVAAVVTYFMPQDVVIEKTTALGSIFATTSGQTLYRRDGWLNQSGGGHSFPHGQPNRPAVGRDIGTNSRCNIEQFDTMYEVYAANGFDCNKVWKPFLASKDAQPSGFWDIAMREDGTRQWVYDGYAMWTYAGDKKPGEINGNDSFDFVISEDPNKEASVGTQVDGIASLFWIVAEP
jgi:predicted lipoprotein with Yx(FWY)xxD motif